ncbi:putative fimbrial adhesin [Xenorhabdus poinarii G6]|uniref:Putative fimbrial adhesin n=1 Tax=Xenorhabdus poinarii G6 TaxID=1354304 RepID=A0A068R2A7_9GAMM|nr:fimbrial protein [Xenorhabdus poinarii]CDG21422.1 putative fimbrial adhesin [Xenorhabdus poinarii G6]
MAKKLKLLLASTFFIGTMSSFDSLANFDSLTNRYCQYSPGFAPGITPVSFGAITIPRDHPIGTTIKEIRLDQVNEAGNIALCNADIKTTWDRPYLRPANYNNDAIYESGVPGVGIRINTWATGYDIDWLPRTADHPFTCRPPQNVSWATQYCGESWGYLTVQLIKIASTTGSGAVRRATLTRAKLGNDLVHTFYLSDTYITTKGCTLSQGIIPVPMGDIKKSDFRGIYSTAGRRDFNIKINCDANVNVGVTLEGTPAFWNHKNIWALDYSDNVTAKGVGLQILYLNRPVSMHDPVVSGSSQSGGDITIPLQAHYIQTDSEIIPGQANATATVTLIYQ